MTFAQYFQPTRFIHLLKKDGIYDQKRTWLVAGAILIIMLCTILFWAWDGDNSTPYFYDDMFPGLLFAGGFLYTSFAFRDLDSPDTGHLYLSLPASNFEKFLSKFLITTIGFVLTLIVSWWLFSVITGGIIESFFDMEVRQFKPLTGDNWLYLKVYFVLQSLFFLGAVMFRKYAAVKTIVSGFALMFGLVLIVLLIIRIVFNEFFDGFEPTMSDRDMMPTPWFQDFAEHRLFGFSQFIFWIVLPLFFWTVSYFKLKEQEI